MMQISLKNTFLNVEVGDSDSSDDNDIVQGRRRKRPTSSDAIARSRTSDKGTSDSDDLSAAAHVSVARLRAVLSSHRPPPLLQRSSLEEHAGSSGPSNQELWELHRKLKQHVTGPDSPKKTLVHSRVESTDSVSTMVLSDVTRVGSSNSISTMCDETPILRVEALATSKTTKDKARAAVMTTVMIRNIPNRYTQNEFIEELEQLGFADMFDFVYLPVDKKMVMNVGYAFVNFIDSAWAQHCLVLFDGYRFRNHQRKGIGKPTTTSMAHIQGAVANVNHYEKAAANSAKMREHRPLIKKSVLNMLK